MDIVESIVLVQIRCFCRVLNGFCGEGGGCFVGDGFHAIPQRGVVNINDMAPVEKVAFSRFAGLEYATRPTGFA